MAKLKSCPFCGSKDISIEIIDENYSLYCEQCEIEQGLYNSLDEAINAWNRRANIETD